MSDQPPRIPCLFVYGTLMTAARGKLGADMRAKLAEAATWIGPATTAGRLVDFGEYPGLVVPVGLSDTVHGEVFELHAPDAVFAWLDDYEGIPPIATPNDEYERVVVPVRLASGEDIKAWVYRYVGDGSTAARIPDGRWTG